MIIKVLGDDMRQCHHLEENINAAVEQAGVAAVVERLNEEEDILKYEVKSTPAVVIDDQVVSSGKLLTVKELKDLF
ncbi:thioredoxin family protein [Mesobacillus subterraneus]|uniref:Thioredoxin family protein n=1 Tax=Mesobacillus subterraneus TaxID=285983 RepID=A0A427TYA2_9BACI|nr:thioredoxin family protein [Mesobacillus subterraneus]RSD29180.1 thioredoxin family protein [Mesobacillus subterraneus]